MAAARFSKYSTNQFLTHTAIRYPLMSEILADTLPRATTAAGGNPAFAPVLGQLAAASAAWDAGETAIANAEAALPAATLAFVDKMASLARKPDADTHSILEFWAITVRIHAAYLGPVYRTLLPQGRRTLTAGSREKQLDAIRDFGTRLSAQAGTPEFVALGTAVTAFWTAARALRDAQTTAKGRLESARLAQEPRRIAAAGALFALIGQGMVTWHSDTPRIDTLWDVNLLRRPPRQIPAAPADTTWDPATRTLSTTALPPRATRLQAWRTGPGTQPELLDTAAPRATAVILPAAIPFVPGSVYQLWLVALNSKGHSLPGPVQSWRAE